MKKHLIVLGAGTAGTAAARAMAARGGTATLVHLGAPEGLPLGGCCLNVGCVPSKYLIRAAERVWHGSHAAFPAVTPQGVEVDGEALLRDMRSTIDGLRKRNYEDPLPGEEGIELIEGRGRLRDARSVEVNGRVVEGDAVLVATGSRTDLAHAAALPPELVLTNENLFARESFPKSVLVVGGGYIAAELGQMLNRMGVRTTMLQRSGHLLSGQPAVLGDTLGDFMRQEGVNLLCGVNVQALEAGGEGVVARAEIDGETREFTAERVLMARGRLGNTDGLFPEGLGVERTPRGYVQVNERLETGCPGVYAVGDVLGTYMLVYTASAEAERVVALLHGEDPPGLRDEEVPWVVFTDPQMAGVGWSLEEARARGVDAEEAELPVNRWPRFSTVGEERGFLKLVRDRETDTLVGARALCPEAGDLAGELGRILRHRIPLRDVAATLVPYLTLNEGIQRCAEKFG